MPTTEESVAQAKAIVAQAASRRRKFFKAADHLDVETLQSCLAEDPTLGRAMQEKGKGPDGQRLGTTALMLVARQHPQREMNGVDVGETCLMALLPFSDVKAKNVHGQTALMLAAASGHLANVEALLFESDGEAKDDDHDTALMEAVRNGHPTCVQAVLPISDPNAKNRHGQTALMLSQNLDMVEVLLPVSDANVKDRDGLSFLHQALARESYDGVRWTPIVLRLLEVTNLDLLSEEPSVLDVALRHHCSPTVVGAIVAKNPLLGHRVDSQGRTPLFQLLQHGNTASQDAIDLIAKNVTPSSTADGETLLMAVASSHRHEWVERWAPPETVNATTLDGTTALMVALTSPSAPKMVQALVDAGANVNQQNARGYTALMIAAAFGLSDACKTLINAGAEVNLTNVEGATALLIAADTRSVLKTWGRSGHHRCPNLRHDEAGIVLDLLLDAGANPLAQDQKGMNVLTHLIESHACFRMPPRTLERVTKAYSMASMVPRVPPLPQQDPTLLNVLDGLMDELPDHALTQAAQTLGEDVRRRLRNADRLEAIALTQEAKSLGEEKTLRRDRSGLGGRP